MAHKYLGTNIVKIKTCRLYGSAFVGLLLFISLFYFLQTAAFANANRIYAATNTDIPVLNHPASQEFPDVDGVHIVWQDARYGPTEIFMKNLDTGDVTNLTETANDWEVFPAIDGDYVIWKDGYDGIGIHGMDLQTGDSFTVTTQFHELSRPRISGNIVVWSGKIDETAPWSVYGYDLSTSTPFLIADEEGNQQDPQIDGNYVVWWDDREHVYLYNLETEETITVHDQPGARLPDVSMADNLVVWQDFRNQEWDIYGYNLTTSKAVPLVVEPGFQEVPAIHNGLITYQNQAAGNSWDVYVYPLDLMQSFPVSDNPNLQLVPAVDESIVVWADNRNHQMDIYYFEWTGTIPPLTTYPLRQPTLLQAGAYPNGQIRLQWEEEIAGEQGFIVERSRGITGTAWTELDRIPANSTAYIDSSGQVGETYWYRVKAFNQEGESNYTADSFNSTFATVPSPDEQHLMLLINEARFDPGAFGYTDYDPVPPVAYNANVAYSARSHSQSILNSNFQFGHCDPTGRCPTERAMAAGYVDGFCAENLIAGTTGPQAMADAHQQFMDSIYHRPAIMEPNFTEFAVGHTHRVEEGGAISGQMTEVFCWKDDPPERPAVAMGSVIPYTGTQGTRFTYAVNFYDADKRTPTAANVYIDGEPHALQLSTGEPYQGTWRYTTVLTPSIDHTYYFEFEFADNTSARWPQSGAVNYPDSYSTIEIDLKPSLTVTPSVDSFDFEMDIFNAGATPAVDTEVFLYVGDPDKGGQVIYTTTLATLGAGEHKILTETWIPPQADAYSFTLRVEAPPDISGAEPSVPDVVEVAENRANNVFLPLVNRGE